MRRLVGWATERIDAYVARYKKVRKVLPQLPIAHFYQYLWENDKALRSEERRVGKEC